MFPIVLAGFFTWPTINVMYRKLLIDYHQRCLILSYVIFQNGEGKVKQLLQCKAFMPIGLRVKKAAIGRSWIMVRKQLNVLITTVL